MTTIKLRRGTSSTFSTNNPTLAAGEPAFETDTGKLKIGDGTTAYNSLAYVGDGFGLKNNATGTDSLAILGTTNKSNSVVIGSGASAAGPNSVIIGTGATTSGTTGQRVLIGANSSSSAASTVTIGYNISNNGQYTVVIGASTSNSSSNSGVAIGNSAKCVSANQSVALGYKAESRASGAIQLGEGSNTSSNTLKFRSYQLLSSSGYIPNDRLNLDTTVTSASGNPVTSGAVYTAIDGLSNTYANVNLSNTSNTGYIKMASASMPSNTYTDLTLGASGTTYTAPADGWFYLSKVAGASAEWAIFTDGTDGVSGSIGDGTWAAGYGVHILRPVAKGVTVKLEYSLSGTTDYFRFIYAVGSTSEYTPASNS